MVPKIAAICDVLWCRKTLKEQERNEELLRIAFPKRRDIRKMARKVGKREY